MKQELFDQLFKEMEKNKDIYLIFVDLGYNRVDEFLKAYPDRAFTVGASEQTALDMAVGLSLAGKIPVIYTITTFYWRAAETIRTYIDHEKLHCVLVGAGVDEEYSKHDGFSHDATDISDLFDVFKNIMQHYPDSKDGLLDAIDLGISLARPHFINIHR